MTTEMLMVHALKRGLLIADFHELSIGMMLDYLNQYDLQGVYSGCDMDTIAATQQQFNNF